MIFDNVMQYDALKYHTEYSSYGPDPLFHLKTSAFRSEPKTNTDTPANTKD
jgi:hypothetical protein